MNQDQHQLAQDQAAKLAFKILSLDKIEKDAKKEKEEHKEALAALCNSVFSDKFIDNAWPLPEANAVIKLALNPHKVIDTRNNAPLDPKQRQEVALLLSDKYCTVDLNVKEIQASIELDKQLKHILKNGHIAIAQETRYDVKKA